MGTVLKTKSLKKYYGTGENQVALWMESTLTPLKMENLLRS